MIAATTSAAIGPGLTRLAGRLIAYNSEPGLPQESTMETDAKPPPKFDDQSRSPHVGLCAPGAPTCQAIEPLPILCCAISTAPGCGSSGRRRGGSKGRTKKEPRPREKGGASWLG